MRLINVETMKLEEYFGSQIPKYGILSHCVRCYSFVFLYALDVKIADSNSIKWGTEEVTFQDFASPDWRRKRGASKIELSSSICRQQGLKYIWIDTCCIDKSSSAELSEAINSMYKWYAQSVVCFAYLEDVGRSGSSESMRKSRWFTRGWTLQELIAPSQMEFFDQQWLLIGNKHDFSALLSEITSVPEYVLEDPSKLRFCSVARKMSLAAYRNTTREEDIAYCLLGIFDVNMPLLYGEGEKAFTRLQEEILKETDDQSLFAWGISPRDDILRDDQDEVARCGGVLALHPVDFAMSENIVPFPSKAGRQPYSMTNKGLQIELTLARTDNRWFRDCWTALLDCNFEDDFSSVIGITLYGTGNTGSFEFLRNADLYAKGYSIESLKKPEVRTIFIRKRHSPDKDTKVSRKCLVRVKCPAPNVYTMEQAVGYNTKWNPEAMVLDMAFQGLPPSNYASTIIMFTDGEHSNNSFAIITAIDEPDSSSAKVVDIQPKPRDVNVAEWKRALKAKEIDWEGRHENVLKLKVLPDGTGVDRPLTVKASLTMEEILNQEIYVLNVAISRGMPRIVGKSRKRDTFKRLSDFT